MGSLTQHVAGIAALADPLRRRLYEFVCAQPDPVSREQAAEAVGVPLHQAKFHLDRLADEGLLETDFARLTGRTGPGAGRTAKRYRRTRGDIAVSLPPREYELAGRLMADAIAESTATGTPVAEALNRIAYDHGMAIGRAVVTEPPSDARAALEMVVAVLTEHGYQPRYADGEVYLTNCPFHALAQAQAQLACAMNHALISGVADALRPYTPRARLRPGRERCCVVLTAT